MAHAYASPAMRIASQYRTASADAKEGEEGSLEAFYGNVAARYGHPDSWMRTGRLECLN